MEALLPWNKDAAQLLNQFLETPTGRLFLAQLQLRAPTNPAAKRVEAAALAGQFRAGYEKCLAEVMLLSEIPDESTNQQPPDRYPSLDDDSKWGEQKETK